MAEERFWGDDERVILPVRGSIDLLSLERPRLRCVANEGV